MYKQQVINSKPFESKAQVHPIWVSIYRSQLLERCDLPSQSLTKQAAALLNNAMISTEEEPKQVWLESNPPAQKNYANAALLSSRKCVRIQDWVREINAQSMFKGRHTQLLLSLYL